MPTFLRRTTEVALVGMRFHVRVGILPHERELAQPLEVDLRVGLLSPADRDLLDYRELHAAVRDVVAGEPLSYLEDIARAVLDRAISLPRVDWARVAVRKPHVALEGPLAWAEVVMEERAVRRAGVAPGEASDG